MTTDPTPEDRIDQLLSLARAHGYVVSQIEVPANPKLEGGRILLDLVAEPPAPLSDLESGPKSPDETPGNRAARVLDV